MKLELAADHTAKGFHYLVPIEGTQSRKLKSHHHLAAFITSKPEDVENESIHINIPFLNS